MPIKSGTDSGKREVSPVSVVINYILPLFLAAVVALYIGCVLSCRVVIEASINSTPVGYIESSSVLPKLKYEVENQLASELGSPYSLDCEFSYRLTLARDPKLLSDSALTLMLLDYAKGDFVEAYMLYVDDRQVGANTDHDGMNSLISEIEAELLEAGSDESDRDDSGGTDSGGTEYSRVEIQNRIKIKKQLCEKSSIKTLDEINALLNPINDSTPSESETTDNGEGILRISASHRSSSIICRSSLGLPAWCPITISVPGSQSKIYQHSALPRDPFSWAAA